VVGIALQSPHKTDSEHSKARTQPPPNLRRPIRNVLPQRHHGTYQSHVPSSAACHASSFSLSVAMMSVACFLDRWSNDFAKR
jgi:hypothetical protein